MFKRARALFCVRVYALTMEIERAQDTHTKHVDTAERKKKNSLKYTGQKSIGSQRQIPLLVQ